MEIIFHIDTISNAAKEFLAATSSYSVFAFNAEMGVGKTTFIKALCKELGVIDTVASPTFAIINEYKTDNNKFLYHFDLYRLNTIQDLQNIGAEDYFYSGNMCFIEWPDLAQTILPPHTLRISITETEKGYRKISF
ncbi:MAG TPA: tRNA (adenosine(37)-N6)-threonylcarbamoyltransferase complex ATPase subunit type 1 TsaE [Bacteroidales bacterium]|nr:MAG: tRNA threonylcarbamoyladenosine biosynthesis protein TsaE [Bacteroidetes bacterium ADurb.Bin217]HPM13676.1 tRNA (adenosine(37)-N6)-threonylcarbamoyltransferase complex ATPase subunit type 1 TsaE [Bacteroidales bacterium]